MWTQHLPDKWLRLIYACTYVRSFVYTHQGTMTMPFIQWASWQEILAIDQDHYQGICEWDKLISVIMLQSTHYMLDLKDHERNHCMKSLILIGLFPSLKTDKECLMKDDLGRYCPKNFETARERKKGGAAGSQTQGLWLKPRALCHWALTPTDSHSSLFPFYYFVLSDCAEIRKRSIAACRWLLDLTPLMVLQIQH